MSFRRLRVLLAGIGVAPHAPTEEPDAPPPRAPEGPPMSPPSDIQRFFGGIRSIPGGDG